MMETAPYQLDAVAKRPPTMGLVVLQADETIEDEFRHYLRDRDVVLHHSRIPSAAQLTHASLEAMAAELTAAVGLFPVGAPFDVIGYACTSASAVIGEARVASLIAASCPGARASNPTTAAKLALARLNAHRIALLTPYSRDVADQLSESFAREGYQIAGTSSFDEDIEARVARIAPRSIFDAAVSLAESTAPEAIFISCTNLRCAKVIAELEQRLDIPVLASNQVLLWHMLMLCGVARQGIAPDRLFQV